MYKINNIKKIIEYLNVLRKYFRVRKKLVMKYKKAFLLLKMSFKLPLRKLNIVRKGKEKSFWLKGDGLICFHYESYGKK